MEKSIKVRVVLIEKIKNEHPYKKLEIVQKIWINGQHPKSCKGICKINSGFMMEQCVNCGWDNF
jgi:hypothetical protein